MKNGWTLAAATMDTANIAPAIAAARHVALADTTDLYAGAAAAAAAILDAAASSAACAAASQPVAAAGALLALRRATMAGCSDASLAAQLGSASRQRVYPR